MYISAQSTGTFRHIRLRFAVSVLVLVHVPGARYWYRTAFPDTPLPVRLLLQCTTVHAPVPGTVHGKEECY